MEQNYNTPKEVIESNISTAVNKAALPFGKMILLGILAGIFIALGGAGSNVAVHDIANVGLQRTLAGVIFPAGLIMIVLVGGELFTGNCLMTMAAWDKKIKWNGMLRNLVVVFFSNLIGALVIVLLVSFSGQFDYTGGKLGAYTISVAAEPEMAAKTKAPFTMRKAFVFSPLEILADTSFDTAKGRLKEEIRRNIL